MRTLFTYIILPTKRTNSIIFQTIREELSSVLECPYRSSSQLLFKTIIEFLYESAADISHTWGLLFFICKERATGIVKAKLPLLKYFYLCYFFTVFFFNWCDVNMCFCLKVQSFRFENLPLCLCSYKNNALKISHS